MRREMFVRTGLSMIALAAVAVAATAQEDRARERERERVFTWSIGPEGVFSAMRRGRMGIVVDLTANAARDSIGARVVGVTPGGPADRAGLQVDDIVTRINGTRLAAGGAVRDPEDDGRSGPGLRLVEISSRLDRGDTVRLDVRRGNRSLVLTFQADESDTDVVVRRMREGVFNVLPREGLEALREPGTGRVAIRVGGAFADLELVRMNAGLGEYFGTSEGVLVVDAGRDSSLSLRPGDVLLTIGGRRVTTPTQAFRILGTYDAGEAVGFEVMRQRRRTTVNGRVPELRSWSIHRNSYELDVPDLRMRIREPLREMIRSLPHQLIRHDGTGVVYFKT